MKKKIVKRQWKTQLHALHEVSAEARQAKENLLNIQAESESDDAQIEDLKLVLKATNENYQSMLDEARYEINVLVCIIENSKSAFENSKAEWEHRELQLVSCIKKNEEEKGYQEKEIKRLFYLLKETEEEANANREEEDQFFGLTKINKFFNQNPNDVVFSFFFKSYV